MWRKLLKLDWFLNGTLTENDGKRRLPRLWAVPFLLLLFFLVAGPMPAFSWNKEPLNGWQTALCIGVVFAVAIAVGAVLDHLLRRIGVKIGMLFWGQFAAVGLVMLFFLYAVIWGGHLEPGHLEHLENEKDPSWLAADDWTFPHVWQPLALLVFLVMLPSPWIARYLLSGLEKKIKVPEGPAELKAFCDALSTSDPANSRVQPSLLKSCFDAFNSPVEILFPAALFLVVVDLNFAQWLFSWIHPTAGWWIYYIVAGLIGVGAYVGLVVAERYPAINELRMNLRRIFWYGGTWATTVLVIVLAGCWLMNVSYVVTVMQGGRTVVDCLLLASYALFWTCEYWSNHIYSEKLLGLLGKVEDRLYVKVGEICICVHGSAKLSLVQPDEGKPAIRGPILERTELFDKIFQEIKKPELAHELEGAAKMYFFSMHALIVVPVVLFAMYVVVHYPCPFFVAWLPNIQHPGCIPIETANLTDEPGETQLKDMEKLLFESSEPASPSGGRPTVILLAASGGGTRAALFTSSVLDGLRLKKHIKKVKAVSGVSGGGVALAYFAAHHDELAATPNNDAEKQNLQKHWDDYHDAMAYHFFIDVMRGAPEFRIPLQTSISTLLAESLERQFYKNDKEHTERAKRDALGKSDIGVIFNTTFVAESPPPFLVLQKLADQKDWTSQQVKVSANQIRHSEFASGLNAGSRVIFTNLDHPDTFLAAREKRYPWNEVLRYLVINDPKVRLTRAASLNANFPPVFPNAPVAVKDKKGDHWLWLTDGGAEENRGQVSLLLAVRGAIERRIKAGKRSVLPDIHLIVAEASGGSTEYKQDFGISAAANAPQKLANQLAVEIGTDITRLYRNLHADQLKDENAKAKDHKQTPKFETHYLPMPSAYRIDGGVGTHWMLPETVRLGPPTVLGINTEPDIFIDRDSARFLIRELHNDNPPGAHSVTDKDIKKIQSWAKSDPLLPTHAIMWTSLCEALEGSKK
jgi:predicted patatin/cPLA2 family phospholipase